MSCPIKKDHCLHILKIVTDWRPNNRKKNNYVDQLAVNEKKYELHALKGSFLTKNLLICRFSKSAIVCRFKSAMVVI